MCCPLDPEVFIWNVTNKCNKRNYSQTITKTNFCLGATVAPYKLKMRKPLFTSYYMLIQWLNTGVLTQLILCQTDSCVLNLKNDPGFAGMCTNIQAGRGRRAVSTGPPFGTRAATAALPTPPPPHRPAPTTITTTRSQGDVTAARICCQPGVSRDWRRSPVRLRYRLKAGPRLWES